MICPDFHQGTASNLVAANEDKINVLIGEIFLHSTIIIEGLQAMIAMAARGENCDWRILDTAASHFVFAGANSSMPVNENELDEVCHIAEQAISLSETFTKDCSTGLGKVP